MPMDLWCSCTFQIRDREERLFPEDSRGGEWGTGTSSVLGQRTPWIWSNSQLNMQVPWYWAVKVGCCLRYRKIWDLLSETQIKFPEEMLTPQISPKLPIFMERSLNVPPQAPKPHCPQDAHFFIYHYLAVWCGLRHSLPSYFRRCLFFWPFQDFSWDPTASKICLGLGFFCCSYHKYPPCMAPDVMKWWMWSSLAFPKSRSRFLLQSDPKQIVGMSWALLLSLTQLLLELLNSFINLSPISKTGGGREWWTALRKAQKEPVQGYLMPNSHRSCCCLFVPRGKNTWKFAVWRIKDDKITQAACWL